MSLFKEITVLIRSHFTGSTAATLQLWKGDNVEPYLHFISLGNPFGYLFASFVGTQVLSSSSSSREDEDGWEPIAGLKSVQAYFVLLGLVTLVLLPAYLCIETQSDQDGKKADEASALSKRHWIIIFVFMVGSFLTSTSYILGEQLPLYAANVPLGLSRSEGSLVALLFWLGYSCSRIVAILISTRIDATRTVHAYLALVVAACAYVWRDSTLTFAQLQVCVAVVGVGCGPLQSAITLIYEGVLPLTPRILSLAYFGNVAGVKLLPILVGVFIEEHPPCLFYLGGTALGSMIFIFATLQWLKPKIHEFLNCSPVSND